MKTKRMVRVVDRIPVERYSRDTATHERFLGWALMSAGVDPVWTAPDGIVVAERNGKRRLSVREIVKDDRGHIIPTADGTRVQTRRRSVPIAGLPGWL